MPGKNLTSYFLFVTDKYLHSSSHSSSSESSADNNLKSSKDTDHSKIPSEKKEKPHSEYKFADITNKEDNKIRQLLDNADKLLNDVSFITNGSFYLGEY